MFTCFTAMVQNNMEQDFNRKTEAMDDPASCIPATTNQLHHYNQGKTNGE